MRESPHQNSLNVWLLRPQGVSPAPRRCRGERAKTRCTRTTTHARTRRVRLASSRTDIRRVRSRGVDSSPCAPWPEPSSRAGWAGGCVGHWPCSACVDLLSRPSRKSEIQLSLYCSPKAINTTRTPTLPYLYPPAGARHGRRSPLCSARMHARKHHHTPLKQLKQKHGVQDTAHGAS